MDILTWSGAYSCNHNKNVYCKKTCCKYNKNGGECNKTTKWIFAKKTPLNYIKHYIKLRLERKYDITQIINKINVTYITEKNTLFFQTKLNLSSEDMNSLTKKLEKQTKCKCIILPFGMELSKNIEITNKEAEE